MADALQLVLPFLGALYLAVLWHELGHAVTGRRGGYLVTACGLGLGHPILRARIGGTVYYLCWQRPFQGLTFSLPLRTDVTRRAEVLLLSGGLLAHALAIAACLAIRTIIAPETWAADIVDLVLWVNAAYLTLGLIPLRFRVGGALIESDTLRIIRTLRGGAKSRPTPVGVKRALYQQCVDHLERVGDPTGGASYRTETALIELDCGRIDHAATLLDPDPPPDAPPYLVARRELARAWLAVERDGDPFPHLDAAEAAFADDPGGLVQVELVRLERHVDALEHDPAPIDDVLASIATFLSTPRPSWAHQSAIRLRLRAHLNADRPAAARADLADLPDPGWLTPLVEGRTAQLAGNPGEALQHYRHVLDALARELGGLTERPERRAYLASQERLLEWLLALGPTGQTALDELLDSPTAADAPVDSHLAVLGLWFVGGAILIELILTALAIHAPELLSRELQRQLATIAGSASIAGVGAALMSLTSKDRKRLAGIALALGPVAAIQALALLRRLVN